MDLITSFRQSRILQDCRKKWLFLSLCSVIGSGIGVLGAVAAGNNYFLLMRMAVGCRVSIVDTAVAVFIPFLVSLFLIVHSKPWLVSVICSLHISLYSATGYAIAASFGSAGWMVRHMLQFPDLILIPVLLFMSVCKLQNRVSKRLIYFCIAVAAMVGLINYCVISPFLANLIENYETMGRYAIHVGLDRCL